MKKFLLLSSFVFCSFALSVPGISPVPAAPAEKSSASLHYEAWMKQPVPIPRAENTLPTVTAEPWFQVPGGGRVLEGAVIDAKGSLIFSDVTGHRVMRLTPDKKLSVVVELKGLSPAGLALHKDGSIFITAVFPEPDGRGRGAVLSVNPDGNNLKEIVPAIAGYVPDDMVFDAKGGFYFTDFRGTSTDPAGGVFYVSADFTTITPVVRHLAKANGIALSPDGKTLWITEYARGLLHRVELADAVTSLPVGTAIAYHFIGPAPDSMRADADGNLYVAMHRQGRFLVFNKNGIPISQILIPGREQGKYMKSTSLALSPKGPEAWLLAGDGDAGNVSGVFLAGVFARGL